MLVLFTSEESASSQSFVGLGWILSTIGAVIILNASLRAGYLVMQKYTSLMGMVFEEADPDHNKLKTERVVWSWYYWVFLYNLINLLYNFY